MKNPDIPHVHSDSHNIDKLSRHVSNIDAFQTVSEVFKQLGDTSRIRIFWLLCHCKECVTDIAALLNMSTPAVSHHLRVLKNCKLINSERVGKEVFYSSSDSELSQLMHIMIEKVMEINCPEHFIEDHKTHDVQSDYPSEQLELIHQVHDELILHMDQKITIESLAKQYLINPTTLKTQFKEVYGNSIAAHVKEHRMEHAAKLLTTTELSLSDISHSVGYENQSKFTEAFKAAFGILPKEYRKKNKPIK